MLETVIVLAWISAAIFSGIIASSKGRSGVGWAVAGLIFGPFGMLAAGLIEPMSVEYREQQLKRRRDADVKRRILSESSKPNNQQEEAERRRRDDEDAAVVADAYDDMTGVD